MISPVQGSTNTLRRDMHSSGLSSGPDLTVTFHEGLLRAACSHPQKSLTVSTHSPSRTRSWGNATLFASSAVTVVGRRQLSGMAGPVASIDSTARSGQQNTVEHLPPPRKPFSRMTWRQHTSTRADRGRISATERRNSDMSKSGKTRATTSLPACSISSGVGWLASLWAACGDFEKPQSTTRTAAPEGEARPTRHRSSTVTQ